MGFSSTWFNLKVMGPFNTTMLKTVYQVDSGSGSLKGQYCDTLLVISWESGHQTGGSEYQRTNGFTSTHSAGHITDVWLKPYPNEL